MAYLGASMLLAHACTRGILLLGKNTMGYLRYTKKDDEVSNGLLILNYHGTTGGGVL